MNRLDPIADLNEPEGRQQLNETLDLLARGIRQGLATTGAAEPLASRPAHRDLPVGAILRRATNQSALNQTATPVQFVIEDYNEGCADLTIDNTRITFPEPGLWLCAAEITWAANSTGNRGMTLLHRSSGGTEQARTSAMLRSATNANPCVVDGFTCFDVSLGDYMDLTGQQSSGGSLNITAAKMAAVKL